MGGLNRISAAMAQIIEENGGVIHYGSKVAALDVDGRTVKGVILEDGQKIMADEVVINADFAHAMQHLLKPGQLSKYTPDKLDKLQYSCSTMMLYLGVDKIYDLPHHTIVFAGDYRRNIREIFSEKKLSDDFSFYVQNASASDPGLAPEGKSTLYVLVPMPNNDSQLDWPALCAKVREQVMDALSARLGLDDIRQHIECEKIITPQDWQQQEYLFKGATFSLAHSFRQMLHWRPHNRFEELDHCYLVGGGTHPGSGLPTIYESARISAGLIASKYGLALKKTTMPWLKR
jgi:phytoene desaturase